MDDARAAEGWREVRSGLRLLLWAWIFEAALAVGNRVASLVIVGLAAGRGFDFALWLSILRSVMALCSLGMGAMLVVGAGGLAWFPGVPGAERAPGHYRSGPSTGLVGGALVRGLGRAAQLGLIVSVAVGALSHVVNMLRSGQSHTVNEARWATLGVALWVVDMIAWTVAMGGLLLACLAIFRALAIRAPIALAGALFALIAVGHGIGIWTSVTPLVYRDYPWVPLVQLGIVLLSAGGFVVFLRRTSGVVADPPTTAASPRRGVDQDGPAWEAAGAGLARVGAGLQARLLVLLVAAASLVVAGVVRAPDAAKLVLLALPVAAMAATAVTLSGLVKLVRVPPPTRAADYVRAALVLLGLTLPADAYGLSLVVDRVSDRTNMALDASRQAPWIELGSQGLAIFGLLFLLEAFGRLAAHLGARALRARTSGVAVLLVLVLAGAMGLRWLLTEVFAAGEGMIVLLGFPVLVVAIVGVARYLGVVRELGKAISARAEGRQE